MKAKQETNKTRKATSIGIGAILTACGNIADAMEWVDDDVAEELAPINTQLLALYYELKEVTDRDLELR